MSVLVATSDGYHVFTSSGQHHTALTGHSVDAFSPGPDSTWVGIVDAREVWQHAPDGTWTPLARAHVELSAIHAHGDVILVGTYDTQLLRLDDGELTPIPSFATMPGRDAWHAVGSPLNIRSMSTTADGSALLANVHVGGIPRSTDSGATWLPTIEVDDDVHEVRAHPSDPNIVMAAAAVGLCESSDGGVTWSIETRGLHASYARALAFLDDEVLLSASEGPFTRQSAIYRRPIAGGAFERVGGSLPEWLVGNVDTGCLATGRGQVALGDGGGNVWGSTDGAEGWHRLAEGLGEIHAVAVA